MKHPVLKIFVLGIVIFSLSSCALNLPLRRPNANAEVSVNNTNSQIESLSSDEYEILEKTTGSASTSRYYILFIPIGKHKSNSELYDNAYYDAIENVPDADGLIFPRQKNSKKIIPLVLVNFYRRDIVVSGVAIKVKGKNQ